ncbi:MAG: histidine kinase [Clostridiales bacterium]|nr:histidine kinase [Clostridiales bacterium]
MDGSVSYIINERDALVASSDSALSGIYWLSYDTIEASFMSSNNFIERNILDETVYAGYYNISQPGWFMVTILPSQPLIARGNRLTLMFLGIYLITALLAFILAVSLSRSITGRLSSVVNQMQTVRQGPPVPMESPVVHDEVGDLIDTYNFMTRRMNHLLRQQSRNAEELRIAEFNSLQAQINPHFLYNTMDMINWMALQGRTSEVSDAIQKLSRFYKLTLSQKSSIVSIASEIEHVSIYADLQNMRFHDTITLITDIPDELTRFQMPKLTLQPVVENAILHGILEKDSKAGTIVLTGWMEMDDIVLLVSDDGIGIPPEKLANILTGTGNSSSGGTNIGVFNTHRRLQILYGTNYGLSYSSTPGKGTDVEIRIPAQREYQNHLAAGRIGSSGNPLPLVTVTNRITEGREGELITPQQMVSYSRQVAANRYKLGNLHQISPKLSPRETLYILSHEVNEKYPAHSHDYYELNYLCSGTIINTIDGNPVYMSAGDLIFLNREAVHSLECVKPEALLVNFCLKPESFERTLRSFTESRNLISDFIRGEGREKQNFIFFPLGHSLQAQTYLASIIEEYANNGFSQSFALEGLFLLLFNYLAASNEFSYRGIDSQTWQVVKYLEENCLKLNVDKIAAKFNMTKEQFDAHLKEHTGRSAADLINEERLEHAAALLASHNISIYQISESCGFKDVEEFTRDFQKKFHVSPSEYRNQFW